MEEVGLNRYNDRCMTHPVSFRYHVPGFVKQT